MKKFLLLLLGCFLFFSCSEEITKNETEKKELTLEEESSKTAFFYNTTENKINLIFYYTDDFFIIEELEQDEGISTHFGRYKTAYFFNQENKKIEISLTEIETNSYIDIYENEIKINNNEYVYIRICQPSVKACLKYNEGLERFYYSINNAEYKKIDIKNIYENYTTSDSKKYIRVARGFYSIAKTDLNYAERRSYSTFQEKLKILNCLDALKQNNITEEQLEYFENYCFNEKNIFINEEPFIKSAKIFINIATNKDGVTCFDFLYLNADSSYD